MIDLKTLKDLIKLMAANDLTELDLQDPQGERVTLKRGSTGQVQYVPQANHAPAVAAPAPAPAAAPPGASPAAGDAADAGLVPIKSPMVGTFYAAASPDAKPLCNVGDRVTVDSVICIIEAMKVFNEIKAETIGTVQRVLVTNGQAVEFGQPLYLVKPN